MQLPELQNDFVKLRPLEPEDFEVLYAVASDPAIWEQHPNKNRYERHVFQTFFEGAIQSKGAYIACDKASGNAIGSSRFYDYNADVKSIMIGYTFIAKNYWGKGYNRAMKSLMLEYAFTFAETVYFHVGANNVRSQKAMEKLGAQKIGETEVAYYGEPTRLNFVYAMYKSQYRQQKTN